jgi:predicted amidohydrolase
MRAACFQFDVRSGDSPHNLAEVETGLRAAHARKCDLVVLPEMWPTSFPTSDDIEPLLQESERALARVLELTRTMPITVCGSALARTPGLPTNRWHLIESGRTIAGYDKVHLFAPTAEDKSFTAGDDPPAWAETRSGRVGGIVCYDLRFPEIARHLFRAGVNLITVSAQWPIERLAHWQTLVSARAVESQCFVIACNRMGKASVGRRRMELTFPGASAIVDPDGKLLAEGCGETELVVADLDLEQARTMRVRVPVAKDERPDVYAQWRAHDR